MASDFIPLNADDTKELRKEIGLPITKDIVYWYKHSSCWNKCNVRDYKVVETYMPSGSKSLMITLETGEQVRILGDYLVDMQKSSFLNDISGETSNTKTPKGVPGVRIESNTNTYVVVDIETTGKNHLCDAITEIGAIRYSGGVEEGHFNTLVKTDVVISPEVEKKTGISNDLLIMAGIDLKEACEKLRAFIGNDIVVGHNFTTFDSKFLDDAYVKELNCHFPNDYVDTLYLAKKTLPGRENYKLESLAQEYNVDYSKAHRSLEDCKITHFIYEYLTFGCLLGDEPYSANSDNLLANTISKEPVDEGELVEVDSSEGWRARLASKFPVLCNEFGLKDDSFSIRANLGKKGNISSFAVCVYEPDLVEDKRNSSRYTVLARIKEPVLKNDANQIDIYSKCFGSADEKKRFDKDSNDAIECLVDCIRSGITNYVPKSSSFACCSRYEECSKAKKCIHPNPLYAKACQYRKNLEEGNIFY